MADLAPRGRCAACYLPQAVCICDEIPSVATATRFDVIRHTRECNKLSNTARVANLAMPSLSLHTYGALGPRFDPTPFLRTGAALLFPCGAGASAPLADPAAVMTVIVLDGTWPQARRMITRMPALGRLPRLVVSTATPLRPRLRKPPVPGGMATLEAIAAAVELIEGPQRAQALWQLFDTLVARGRALRGLPPSSQAVPQAGPSIIPQSSKSATGDDC